MPDRDGVGACGPGQSCIAQIDTAHLVRFFRQREDRKVPLQTLKAAYELQTIHVGHYHPGHDQVGSIGTQISQCSIAVAAARDAVALPYHDRSQDTAYRFAVIGQQDSLTLAFLGGYQPPISGNRHSTVQRTGLTVDDSQLAIFRPERAKQGAGHG